MWENNDFDYERDTISKDRLSYAELKKFIEKFLELLKQKLDGGKNFAIYQHLVWTRYDTVEDIRRGVFRYGLEVKHPCISSTTNITGNLAEISADDVMNYYYDSTMDALRDNLGFILPTKIVDEKGRIINFALDKRPENICWNEGYYSAIIDFILDHKSSLSNAYSLFHFTLLRQSETGNEYYINKKAFPFLSKKKQKEHMLELSRLIKEIIVGKYHIASEEEYDNAKDINPFIEKLIADKLAVTTEPYIDPAYWEFP